MPLGKISTKNIKQAFDVLTELTKVKQIKIKNPNELYFYYRLL